MRDIGLHLRITTTLDDLIAKAEQLQLDCFQCFFIEQPLSRSLSLTYTQKERVAACVKKYRGTPILHASYLINLAGPPRKHIVLERELAMAEELGFEYLILHPGSAKHCATKDEGIQALADAINPFLNMRTALTFVLENLAHGGKVIGGDLHDFKLLLSKLDHPERVRFCIDTAHAHGYGYDIITEQGRKEFVALLDETIGIANIVLLHINDTTKEQGSRLDEHAQLGKGTIGLVALRAFAMHEALRNIPLLLELPPLSDEEQVGILEAVREWHA